VAWRSGGGLEWFARMGNVFDKRYASYGAIGTTVFDAQGQYTGVEQNALFVAPGAPRNLYVGLRWTY